MADDQTPTESNADYVKRTSVTVGELRQQYGLKDMAIKTRLVRCLAAPGLTRWTSTLPSTRQASRPDGSDTGRPGAPNQGSRV